MNARIDELDDGAQEIAPEAATLQLLSSAEIDRQIATAKRYPRSLRRFLDTAQEMVTLNEHTAEECIYALPRGGKTIQGPSARFAEIVLHAWGNSRGGARVVDVGPSFLTAQGAFHDLEANVAITFEVRRRITNSSGTRYNEDMIGVTSNAACSIAFRNSVLKGVPKALWSQIYESARQVVLGDATTLDKRRTDAMAYLLKFGATEAMVLATLELGGVDDIGLEELLTLKGLAQALRSGETSLELGFVNPDPKRLGSKKPDSGKTGNDRLKDRLNKTAPQPAQAQGEPDAPADAEDGTAPSEGSEGVSAGPTPGEVEQLIEAATEPAHIDEALALLPDLDASEQVRKVLKGAAMAKARELLEAEA